MSLTPKPPARTVRECIGKLRYAKNRSDAEIAELHDLALEALGSVMNDLLAYGNHLDCCTLLTIAKTDGQRYANLYGCSCGFTQALER